MQKLLLLALLAFASLPVFANSESAPAEKALKTSTPAGWSDDFASAQAHAKKSGKNLVVAFSGSDWCGWCIRLEKEVLSRKSFTTALRSEFIPVYIDLPQDKSRLSSAAQKQNDGVVAHYRIERFPAVLIIDAEGDVVAQTGYADGGPQKYLELLRKLCKEGKNNPVYRAQKTLRKIPQGNDRAEKLDAVLSTLPLRVQIANTDYVREVLATDLDGSRGFRRKYLYFTDILPLEQSFHAEISRLEKLTEEAVLRHGKPQDKAECAQIAIETIRKNSAQLIFLREQAQKVKSRLSKSAPETVRLNSLLFELNHIIATHLEEERD